MVCEFKGLCWRLTRLAFFFQCSVNPAKVVVRHKQGQRVTMVRNGLAVTKRESRNPAIEDTSGQVKPFCMGSY
jgi:hypothetical protein